MAKKTNISQFIYSHAEPARFTRSRSKLYNDSLADSDESGAISPKLHLTTTTSNRQLDSPSVSDSISYETTGAMNEVRRRRKWTYDMNILILRQYFEIMKGNKSNTNYRIALYNAFKDKYPELDITVQNVADQRRAIMKNHYISEIEIEKIRSEIFNNDFHEINSTPNSESFQNCQSVNDQNFQPNIQNDSFLEDFHVINDFQFHTNFKDQIEQEFVDAINRFSSSDPNNRPLIPKQKMSKKFLAIVSIINKYILPKFLNLNMSFIELHKLIYCGALATIRSNGSKEICFEQQNKISEIPHWEARLTQKINNIRKELGQITQYLRGGNSNYLNNCIKTILRKHRVHCLTYEEYNHSLIEVKDTLQQKLSVFSKRLKRYKINTLRKNQNKCFRNNEKIFYRNLNKDTDFNENGLPSVESLQSYWGDLWSRPFTCIDNDWMKDIENKAANINEMANFEILKETFNKVVKRTNNWKTPGNDRIQNFWVKKFTCVHDVLIKHFNDFIQDPKQFPNFLVQGVTYLKPKDADTKNPSKYRPITCLSIVYKIFTSCLSEMIYKHCQDNNILNVEQKGCVAGAFGCKEQLIIDSVIMEQAHINKRNICTAFIDYKKAYDSVPHSWLLKILEIYKIHPLVVTLLKNVMSSWQTRLHINHKNQYIKTTPIPIRRGIFQGDSLSPLWFCLAINPLSDILNNTGYGFKILNNRTLDYKISHLLYMDDIKLYATTKQHLSKLLAVTEKFSLDIGMSFGVDKCKTQIITRGIHQNFEYATTEGELIKCLKKGEVYKYLGFEQANKIQHTIVKNRIRDEFYKRVKLLLKTFLTGRHLIKAVNTYAVPVLTYSFGIVKWCKTDIQNLNIKVRTIFTKFNKHHPRSSIERFIMKRENGGRGFIDLDVLLNNQMSKLKTYFYEKQGIHNLFNAIVKADKKYTPLNLSDNAILPIVKDNDKFLISKIKQKSLHGRFYSELEQPGIDKKLSLIWLNFSDIHPETEGFIFAIQDQVINTKNYKKFIIKDPTVLNDNCRMCFQHSETIQHIMSSCSVLANTEYLKRHNAVGKIIHSSLAIQFHLLENPKPYYLYNPESCLENENYKLYWDRTLLTDLKITANRPDIVVVVKNEKLAYFIDIAVPSSTNMMTTYDTKITKYSDLSIVIKNQWNLDKIQILPLIISTTGLIPNSLQQNLKILNLDKKLIFEIQKAVLLSSCHIVRKFLNVEFSNNEEVRVLASR